MRHARATRVPGMIAVLLAWSCTTTSVDLRESSPWVDVERRQTSALSSNELSARARQELRVRGLERTWQRNELAALEAFEAQLALESSVRSRVALAEAAYLAGRRAARLDRETARLLYTTTLETSHDLLFPAAQLDTWSSDHRLGVELYNASLMELLVHQFEDGTFPARELRNCAGERLQITVAAGPGHWPATYFASFYPADRYDVTGISNRHRQDGLGAALAGLHPRDPRSAQDRFFPAHGLYQPVTVLLELGPVEAGKRHGVLHLVNPRELRSVTLHDQSVTVAADFTLPMAVCLSHANLENQQDVGFFAPEDYSGQTGLHFLSPYDPRKIPVLFVHGLWSSPLTWRNLINDLMADPDLTERYQFWTLTYPTGLPVLAAASVVRDLVDSAVSAIDPRRFEKDAGVVVIAHSMGAILSRTLVQESEDRVWNTFFRVGLAEVAGLSPEDREYSRKLYFFEPRRFIDRLVLVAPPLRGSPRSKDLIGMLGSTFITLPERLVDVGRRLRGANLENMTSEAAAQIPDVPTSIQVLSPENLVLGTLADLPVAEHVRTHLILGSLDGQPTDGIVPHWSSRLESAVSEWIVPAGHDAHHHPSAVREVRRILLDHSRGFEQVGGDATR